MNDRLDKLYRFDPVASIGGFFLPMFFRFNFSIQFFRRSGRRERQVVHTAMGEDTVRLNEEKISTP